MNDILHPFLFGYLLSISLFAFILFGIDKKRARYKAWRISESRLLLVSVLGGSAGSLYGMYVFRHKIRCHKFSIGLPLLFFLQLTAGVYLFFRF